MSEQELDARTLRWLAGNTNPLGWPDEVATDLHRMAVEAEGREAIAARAPDDSEPKIEPVFRVYGASDDLIECERIARPGRSDDIADEWGSYGHGSRMVATDGTVLDIVYSPDTGPRGTPESSHCVWRITVLAKGLAFIRHVRADANVKDGKQSEVGHSDFVELGDIKGIACGRSPS